jgi:hypothetical protein
VNFPQVMWIFPELFHRWISVVHMLSQIGEIWGVQWRVISPIFPRTDRSKWNDLFYFLQKILLLCQLFYFLRFRVLFLTDSIPP